MAATPSSISSSDRPGPFAGPPWGLLAAIGYLIAVELVLRSIDPIHLIPYETGLPHQYTVQMTAQELGCRDIAVVGSSRIEMGILAPEMERSFSARVGHPVTVGNFGIGGSQLHTIDPMIRYMLRSKRPPRAILLGVSPEELIRDPAPTRRSAIYWRAPEWLAAERQYPAAARPLFTEMLRNELADHYLTFRYRWSPTIKFRDFVGRRHALNPVWGGIVQGHLDEPGLVMKIDAATRKRVEHHVQTEHAVNGVYHFRPDNARILQDLATTSRRAGVPLVFFEIPDSPLFQSYMPPGTLEQFRGRMRDIAAASGSVWLPASAIGYQLTNSDYRDPVHANRIGATEMSQKVAKAIPQTLLDSLWRSAFAHSERGS